MAGDLIVVGANNMSASASYSGAAFVFDRDTGTPLATLKPPEGFANAGLGRSISTDGERVLVGMPGFSQGPGFWDDGAIVFEEVLRGDANADDVVDAADYDAWAAAYGRTRGNLRPDLSGDYAVNAADYTLWRDTMAAANASSTPEPATATMLIAVLGSRLIRRRR